MTNPAILTLATTEITSLTGVWNATGTLSNGIVVMKLNDPVNTTNVGFNASGIIGLPTQATLSTNGQTLSCSVIH